MPEFKDIESQRWFDKAEEDLDNATYLIEDDRVDLGVFELHQALEKSFKAYQITFEESYKYSHDLVNLAPNQIKQDYMVLITELNPVYTANRYPDIEGEIEDPEKLADKTKEVLEWIKKQLIK